LLIFWAITSLLAYTIAGEKMPWLTVHITLPMILLSGWAIGYLIDTTDWSAFRIKKGWLTVALLIVFIPAVLNTFRIWLGSNPPFAGKSLEQLSATSGFIISLIVAIASGVGIFFLTKDWSPRLVASWCWVGFLQSFDCTYCSSSFYGLFYKLRLSQGIPRLRS
jgi:hypothetical protein